jgi:rhamnosyltransferase
MKPSVCGIITLYAPPESYLYNIDTYINYLDILYVVDNTPVMDHKVHDALLKQFSNVKILSFGKNIGIGAAINLGIKEGLKNNYSWLLTMDQDSYFDAEQVKLFFNSFSVVECGCTLILSPEHKQVTPFGKVPFYQKRDEVMTSGNLLNLSLIDKVGFFNEDLFIDSVDHDFCLRGNMLNYDILQSTNICIRHCVGISYSGSIMCGLKKKNFHIHSPKRMYFIVRNGLYIREKYGSNFPGYTNFLKKKNKQRISRCLLYSSNRIEYLRYIVKGYFDYSRNKFGNRVNL